MELQGLHHLHLPSHLDLPVGCRLSSAHGMCVPTAMVLTDGRPHERRILLVRWRTHLLLLDNWQAPTGHALLCCGEWPCCSVT